MERIQIETSVSFKNPNFTDKKSFLCKSENTYLKFVKNHFENGDYNNYITELGTKSKNNNNKNNNRYCLSLKGSESLLHYYAKKKKRRIMGENFERNYPIIPRLRPRSRIMTM